MAESQKKKENSEGYKSHPGPEPERVKIDGDWEDVVKRALEAPPPGKDETEEAESREQDHDAGKPS